MNKDRRKWIEDKLNEGKQVQIACTYSNACRWNYLTTSGMVLREEFGYVEDFESEEKDCHYVPKMTFSSVRRYQKALENLYLNG